MCGGLCMVPLVPTMMTIGDRTLSLLWSLMIMVMNMVPLILVELVAYGVHSISLISCDDRLKESTIAVSEFNKLYLQAWLGVDGGLFVCVVPKMHKRVIL